MNSTSASLPLLVLLLFSLISPTLATSHFPCPPKGTNATCAQVGGCGKYCSQVCGCNSACARYPEGCCWDVASCTGPSPGPSPSPSPPSPAPSPGVGPQGGPEGYHIALGADSSATAVLVDFSTSVKWGQASVCEWSAVGATGPFSGLAKGTARTYTDGGWIGMLHRVELTGLTPNAKFWYRCCTGKAATGDTGDTDDDVGSRGGACTAATDRVLVGKTVPLRGHLPITIAAVRYILWHTTLVAHHHMLRHGRHRSGEARGEAR